MTVSEEAAWLDGDAGRLIRPYAVTNGRTTASMNLDLMSMVVATGAAPGDSLGPDHLQVLGVCARPTSVAEVAARLRLPATVAKILLSDLADSGAVRTGSADDPTDRVLLERLLDGLQRRL